MAFEISAQSINVETNLYNEDNGLSRYANFIHKDSRGLIWIGTQFGLYRFDGQEFYVFNLENGLPFRQIMEIYEDSDGWFWLYKSCFNKGICDRNLVFFHPLTQEIKTFEQRFGNELDISVDQIASIAQDSLKTIYFTAANKLISWSSKDGLNQTILQELEQPLYLLSKINDKVFVGYFADEKLENTRLSTSQDIQYVSFNTDGLILKRTKEFPIVGLTINNLNRICRNAFEFDRLRLGNYELWFTEQGEIQWIKLPYQLLGHKQLAEFYDFDGQLSINENGKLFHAQLGAIEEVHKTYPEANGQINRSKRSFDFIYAWAKLEKEEDIHFQKIYIGNDGRHVFFDELTNIAWIAKANGISTYQFSPQLFRKSRNEFQKLEQRGISVVGVNENKVLLKTTRDMILYDSQNEKSDIMPVDFFGAEKFKPKSLIGNNQEQHFWSMDQRFLKRIDRKDLSIKTIQLPSEIEKPSLLLKQKDLIWFRNKKQIYQYNLKLNSFKRFTKYNEFGEFQDRKVYFMKQINDEQLWIGTDKGLYLCSVKQGLLKCYGRSGSDSNYLPADQFVDIAKTKNGEYWLATFSGLLKWKFTSGEYKLYTTKQGLVTNEILAVYEDDYGFVWLATLNGLIQLEIESGLSKTYLKENGLSNSSFQVNAHYRAEDGSLYFGTFDGFTIFHPKDFKDVKLEPIVPLIITNFEQYVGATDTIENYLNEIIANQEIILKPGDKFFNIKMALSDYRSFEKQRFAYRILGYHDEWQEGRTNIIRISGLPYGQYKLQIKGRLSDGQYAHPILDLPLRVLKPFYLKFWFFLLSAVLLVISILLFFEWRSRKFKFQQSLLEKSIMEATSTIRINSQKLKADKEIIENQALELRKLDKVKSRFFANVSHELRTPVALILGPLKSMLNNKDLDEKSKSFSLLALKNAKNLLGLVNEILDLAKLESGRMEVQESVTHFLPLIHRIFYAFEGMAVQKEIQYFLDYQAHHDLWLKLDIKKFEKIVNNLISNAFKYTSPKGQIKLLVQESSTHIHLKLKDSGRGIHQDDLPFVFNRFYQSSKDNMPKEGGTGIGLSLSMELSRLIHGNLWVESEIGKGSSFFFVLPRIISRPVLPEKLLENNSLPRLEEEMPLKQLTLEIGGDCTILVVEDNPHLRTYLRIIIADKYDLITLENGVQAWDYLNRDDVESPALIISDIMMPEMDGFQLLEKLKKSDFHRSIPVIMLTALVDLKDKLKALRIGVDDYMTKPFEEEELLARIMNLLQYAQWRKTYQQSAVKMVKTEDNELLPELVKENFKVKLTKEDIAWLENLETVIISRLGDFNFSVEQLAHDLAMSRWSLYRRIKQLLGLTAIQYLQEVRLNHARNLLEAALPNSVKALSFEVGIKDVKYFSRQFKKRFGKLPSEYL